MDNRKLEDLQRSLDIRKWHDSEDNAIDMCHRYDFCVYCKLEADFPCARAFNRMELDKTKTAKQATNVQKPVAKKPVAAKPAAAKPAAKKPAAKKPAAKK